MANAQVEKLKSVGLRHGEKLVVGLTAALCFLFIFWAATMPTIEITAEQVSKDAEAARSSLARRQEPADILTSLEEQGIKNPEFVKLVEDQQKNLLVVADFKPARSWVSPEPGAGLIRDTPELIAATDLLAYPGRGGALLYSLDPVTKKRIPEDPNEKPVDEATKTRRGKKKKKRRRGGGGSSMSMMSGPAMPSGSARPAVTTEAEKKAAALDKKKREALLAGNKAAAPEEEKDDASASEEGGPFKEVTRGLRWVTITGTIDHKKLRDNYLLALKNAAVAHPNYKQLNVERQTKLSDGTWSEWEAVDSEKNHEITYNLPEEEEELTPDSVRISALVDPLPFLKAGFWEQVHVASLVPKEKLEAEKPTTSMSGGSSMNSGAAQNRMMMGSGMIGSGMMGTSMTMGGNAETVNFPTTEADTIMIRSLDFTVEPNTSYRYRLQIEVFNPNYNREDVAPGTNTKDLEMKGPWSEPTNEVTMPDDITAYAMHKVQYAPNAKRNDRVSYQIIKWNPDDGITVTRTTDYGPGEIVGEPLSTRIPASDGSKEKNRMIDYNSHQLMLDVTGGEQPLTPYQNGKIEIPVVTLLLRPDGSVVVRNQAFDVSDPVRKDMAANYNRELEESSKPRASSNGTSSMMSSSAASGLR